MPVAQPTQAETVVEPVAELYFPARQDVQLDAAAVSPYLPASHSVQEEALDALYCPVAQLTHAVAVVDPAFGLYFPAPQDMQLDAAAVSQYFPASHSVQEEALVSVVDSL